MKEKISVTVIIPCYRCNKTIKRAIDSVLSQTVLPNEIFIIDDNIDKRETIELFDILVKNYGKEDIVMICNIKNKGAPFSRNLGWYLAKSDYVAFLDSDDAWHPQKLELQYTFMKKNSEIILTGHDIEIIKNKKIETHLKYNSISSIECLKRDILLRNIFPTPTLMIKRDINYRFDETMRYVDDHLLLMNIILDGNKAVKIKNKLAYVFKPMFGASGLSSNMYQMEKHELLAYTKIFKANKINILTYTFLIIFSLVKYVRRLILLKINSRQC